MRDERSHGALCDDPTVLVLRRLASVLLVLGAVAALPIALGAVWLERTVTDTATYVDTVAPLADVPAVRESVRVRTTAAVTTALDARGRAEELRDLVGGRSLRPFLQASGRDLAVAVEAYVAATVDRVVASVLDSPAFPDLWRAAHRAAHESLLAALEADEGDAVPVSIDLSEVVAAALDLLVGEGLTVADQPSLAATEFVVVDSGELDDVRTVFQSIDAVGWWAPALVVALVALGLLVSPLRRRTTILAAFLAVLALGVLALCLLAARSVLEAAAGPGEERELAVAVWDALVVGLWRMTGVAAAIAVAVGVLTAVAPWVWRRARDDGATQVGTATPGSS